MSLRRNNLLPLYCQPQKWDPPLSKLAGAERKQKQLERARARSRKAALYRERVRARKRAQQLARKLAENRRLARIKNQNEKFRTDCVEQPIPRRVYRSVADFPKECQETSACISTTLGESDPRVVAKIAAMVETFGAERVSALLKRAKSVEVAGGEWTQDHSRKRTLGGIFFRLAKDELGPQFKQLRLWIVTDCEE